MRTSKYFDALKKLLYLPFFSAIDAENIGIPRQALTYFVEKGVLERIYRGAYRSPRYEPKVEFQWQNLGVIAASIPDGVICLISALCYYDLTDQIMREVWIAVPHQSFARKRPNTRIIRMRNLELGKTEMMLGEYRVQIFDRERTVVDAFRYLSKEIAIKAIRLYFRSSKHKPQPKKLAAYAKALRVNITPYILSCTT